MYPHEAKLHDFTHASTMNVDIKIDYIVRNTDMMDSYIFYFGLRL